MKAYDVQSTAPYTTATLTSDNPFYWQNTAPIKVTAWWPTGDVMPQVVVQANQSAEADYQASDYISATGTVQFDGSNVLQFSHRTAKIVVNPLEAGNGVPEDDLDGATITLTGISTGNPDNGNTVIPYNNNTALLPPQTIAGDEPFIQVILADKTVYSYKPDEAIELKAGCQYTYTITVKKTGLEGSASINTWDGTGNDISGDALPEPLTHTYDQATNTYTVYSAQGLQAWAAAAESDRETNCTLAADIDMAGQSWTTISTDYRGTFDGAGRTISHISGGLFEDVYGTVKNLTIQNASISSSGNYAGMIAGEVYRDSNIENCHVVGGMVTGEYYVGGVVGMIDDQATVRACSSSATVNGNSYTGGIAGLNSGTILSCHATGTATAKEYVGAIAGVNEDAIMACYWSGASANGIGGNSGSTAEAKKTNDWQTAAEAMNAALPDDFGWKWQASDADTPPVTVKKE